MTTPDADSRPQLVSMFRLQWEETQKGYVLLYPEGMVKLNGTAAEILRRCDGALSIRDLVAELEDTFGQSGLENDVREFVGEAIERGWLRV